VIVLSDAYLAHGAEPWRIADVKSLPRIPVVHPEPDPGGAAFQPYTRDTRLARPWAIPGTPGRMHRVGGLEKQDVSGEISYEPANHQRMVDLRAEKVARVTDDLPPLAVEGPRAGRLLVLGWGSTYGTLATAVRQVWERGGSVARAHLRHLQPLPADLGEIVRRYDVVLVPELNRGQLAARIRAEYLVDVKSLTKTAGRPFTVAEVVKEIERVLGERE
jgi:2-oxoglutarate ferredoxin oxidoreductase subunit alpha